MNKMIESVKLRNNMQQEYEKVSISYTVHHGIIVVCNTLVVLLKLLLHRTSQTSSRSSIHCWHGNASLSCMAPSRNIGSCSHSTLAPFDYSYMAVDQFLNILPILKFTHLSGLPAISIAVPTAQNFRHFETQMISTKFPISTIQLSLTMCVTVCKKKMFHFSSRRRTLRSHFAKRKPEFRPTVGG